METLHSHDEAEAPLDLSGVPFAKKWEKLKPYIRQLYIDQHMELNELINEMKRRCSFDAKLEVMTYSSTLTDRFLVHNSTSTASASGVGIEVCQSQRRQPCVRSANAEPRLARELLSSTMAKKSTTASSSGI